MCRVIQDFARNSKYCFSFCPIVSLRRILPGEDLLQFDDCGAAQLAHLRRDARLGVTQIRRQYCRRSFASTNARAGKPTYFINLLIGPVWRTREMKTHQLFLKVGSDPVLPEFWRIWWFSLLVRLDSARITLQRDLEWMVLGYLFMLSQLC